MFSDRLPVAVLAILETSVIADADQSQIRWMMQIQHNFLDDQTYKQGHTCISHSGCRMSRQFDPAFNKKEQRQQHTLKKWVMQIEN